MLADSGSILILLNSIVPSLRTSHPRAPSIVQNRNVLRRTRARQRLHEGVHICDFLVRKHCRGISRHVVGGITQLSFKSVERHVGFGKAWRRTVEGAALPGTAVAGEAPVGEIEALAVPGIAWRSVLGLQQGRSTKIGRSRRKRAFEIFHCESPQRGSVTTSTTAGSPRLTTATARASAPARSFGSTIGPSP